MKRSNAAIANRRSLIQHNHALLKDPDVVDFLNNIAVTDYEALSEKLIEANELPLLLELIRVTQSTSLTLCFFNERNDTVTLPDGLFDYLLQHIDQVPSLTTLTVEKAVLSAACGALLQTALADPACTLTSLTFTDCKFADAHVQFPLKATTIQSLYWQENLAPPGGASPMDQMLSALAGWSHLESVALVTKENPLNFATITQMLVHNPKVIDLFLVSDIAPPPPGDPAYQPQHDPALLFGLLSNNQVCLTKLMLYVQDTSKVAFNQHFVQQLSQCLMTNVSLESLHVPGIKMETPAALTQFSASLNSNHGLIQMAPLGPFGNQVPPAVRRNQSQRYWFTQEFVVGAAEAFLRLIALPLDLKSKVALYVAPTPAERALGGAVMALICKATHEGAVTLRSAGLKEAALIYIRTNDQQRCLELLNALVQHQLDLRPEDKKQVIGYAQARNRMNFLPPGYAH